MSRAVSKRVAALADHWPVALIGFGGILSFAWIATMGWLVAHVLGHLL
jgi:hypothetical protein